MGILGFILRKKSVIGLRKEYDRQREKADRDPDINRKIMILRSLDQLEPTLVALEEQMLSNYDRSRMIKYAENGLKKTKMSLTDKESYTSMTKQPERRR